MEKEVIFESETIFYTHRRSARARRMRLAVHRDGSVVLTTPARSAADAGEGFVLRHVRWLAEKIEFFRRLPPLHPAARYGRREYMAHREEARALVLAKIEQFRVPLKASYNRVSIRNQKTCWGSCSRKGNLNFNYKILFLPGHLQDYVIVHELAHLREFSHSPRFWAHVGSILPDWPARRRELRGMRLL
jgi:predicted metal-dependent hydrolase